MKKQTLGKRLFLIGSLLTVAIACQPKASNMKSPQNTNTNENPSQSDNEDEDVDDGAYGDGDTSSSCGENSIQPVIKVDAATEIADIKDVDESVVETAQEIAIVSEEESSSANVVVLESVTPVEMAPEHEQDGKEGQLP